MANSDSSRPALQPSPLVNASPVASPTSKACTIGSYRPATASTGDGNVPKASDPIVHECKARDVMQQSTNSVAAAAEEAEDDDIDIPEEIEEKKQTLTMLCIPFHALHSVSCSVCSCYVSCYTCSLWQFLWHVSAAL